MFGFVGNFRSNLLDYCLRLNAQPKVDEATENDVPAEEDDDREKFQALAKKFEEKYVSLNF
jgi:hypothetical protein